MTDRVVTASVTLSFKGSTSENNSYLSLEVDSREDGLNRGKTSFRKGDSPGFLMYSGGVGPISVFSSEGAVTKLSTGLAEQVDVIAVPNEDTFKLGKPAVGPVTLQKIIGDSATIKSVEGSIVTLSKKVIAVVQVKYDAQYTGLRLSGAGGSLPVIVMATAEVL